MNSILLNGVLRGDFLFAWNNTGKDAGISLETEECRAQIMEPRHCLIPRIYRETLHGEREFSGVIKLRALRWRD